MERGREIGGEEDINREARGRGSERLREGGEDTE